ncbi:glycosyltransferase family 2 protein [Pseudoxanthomonas dokdonensis]|nr:glycosyltransferase family 2 protein [Pseudoxanthomonas dokdonensis]
MTDSSAIAVVIPCYRVRDQILPLLASIGPEVGWIYVVDDACPQQSGEHVRRHCQDPRVQVITHAQNKGVGGAVVSGYRAAQASAAKVVVKLDGDGQMDPLDIPRVCGSLLAGHADYAKGNRFHRIGFVRGMPWVRLLGNAVLTLLTKLSSGYWQIADPTNGYTALRRELIEELELERVAYRYFFETDLLYYLNQARARVIDVPMRARYQDEPSSLRPHKVALPFLAGHARNTLRRIAYSYFLRGFSLASLQLLAGTLLLMLGGAFGIQQWHLSLQTGVPATAGTVMLAALPIIVGIQMLFSWLNFDVANEPAHPVHPLLRQRQSASG